MDEIKRLEKFPEIVQIESSNICNAKCIMCPVHTDKMTRPRVNMTRPIFEKVVNDCIGKGVKEAHLHQNGEPLILGAEKLADRISYTKEKLPEAKVGFFTNGSLMDENASIKILASRPDFITFSFDGGTKEDYEKVRGLDFELVKNNILRFAELRNKMQGHQGIGKGNTRIQVLMLPQKENEDNIGEYMELFKGSGIEDIGTAGVINYGSALDNSDKRHKYQKPRFSRFTPCWRLWSQLVVGSDGNCCLCCYDFNCEINLGNVMEQSVEEIWQGDVLKKVRNTHILKDQDSISVCKGCDFMEYICPPDFWF